MVILILQVALAALVFVGMEGFAWVVHRYVMHGALWCWHKSHHEPRHGMFEVNDLFAVVFALPAMVAFQLSHGSRWWLAVAVGITGYGIAYAFFHDGLVHRRFPLPIDGTKGFWRSRLQAHRLHHAVTSRDGCVSFGFLWAMPIRTLKMQLDAKRAQTATATATATTSAAEAAAKSAAEAGSAA